MNNRDIRELQERGIVLQPSMQFMQTYPEKTKENLYQIDARATARKMAMDSALAPNVGAPAQFYNVLSPNTINILYDKLAASNILPLRKEGTFADETLSVCVREFTGGTTAYNDFSRGVTSDINTSYPMREQYRFKTGVVYGDLEVEKSTAARISLAAAKQESAAFAMAVTENKVFCRGVEHKQTYGLLNDPNLNSPISALNANINGEQKTKWTDKDKDPVGCANHIANDILAAFNELVGNNGGHIDPLTPMKLVLSQKRAAFLDRTNNYGKTVREIVKNSIPNLEVVTLPECSMAEGERLYLICSQVLGQEAGYLGFTDQLRVSPVIVEDTYKYQSFSGGTWGCILTQPNLVSIVTGI